jgi:hypothetical protein
MRGGESAFFVRVVRDARPRPWHGIGAGQELAPLHVPSAQPGRATEPARDAPAPGRPAGDGAAASRAAVEDGTRGPVAGRFDPAESAEPLVAPPAVTDVRVAGWMRASEADGGPPQQPGTQDAPAAPALLTPPPPSPPAPPVDAPHPPGPVDRSAPVAAAGAGPASSKAISAAAATPLVDTLAAAAPATARSVAAHPNAGDGPDGGVAALSTPTSQPAGPRTDLPSTGVRRDGATTAAAGTGPGSGSAVTGASTTADPSTLSDPATFTDPVAATGNASAAPGRPIRIRPEPPTLTEAAARAVRNGPPVAHQAATVHIGRIDVIVTEPPPAPSPPPASDTRTDLVSRRYLRTVWP